jgi:hypothetical protein
MPLAKFQFRPGINREITNYSNEGGWFDGDKVRFRFGFPEKIGGWEKKSTNSFLGTCSALIPWVTLNNEQYIGVGTEIKYYIERGGAYNDITPVAFSNLLNRSTSIQVLGTAATGSVGSIVKNESQVYPNGVAGSGGVGTVYVGVDGGTVVVIGEAAGATVSVAGVASGGGVGDVTVEVS